MQRAPERAPSSTRLLIGTLSLLMLVAGYGVGYWLALDHTHVTVSVYSSSRFEPIYHSPGDLVPEQLMASFFAPAHSVDRIVRVHYWNEP